MGSDTSSAAVFWQIRGYPLILEFIGHGRRMSSVVVGQNATINERMSGEQAKHVR